MLKSDEKLTLWKDPYLWVLVFAAALMRINFGAFGFSNDELSAILRLPAASIPELWENGVKGDGHPALVQTFLWIYVHIVPITEGWLRLPFVLASLITLLYTYKLGVGLFSRSTALLTVAALAFLEFPLVYSLIARPYAIGWMFTTLAAWYFYRGLIDSRKAHWFHYVGWTLSIAGALYTHYFSALCALLLVGCGLLYARKFFRWPWLVSTLAAGLLFTPHISITLYQLGVGGIGQWLEKPHKDWPLNHIDFVFNRSKWLWIALFLLSGAGWMRLLFKRQIPWKKLILLLLLGCVPFLVGFFYSRLVNPVLQHSVLLFSLPFWLLLLMQGITSLHEIIRRYAWMGIAAAMLFSTTVELNHFNRMYFGDFKQIATEMQAQKTRHGSDIALAGNFSGRGYIGFYFEQLGTENPVDYYINEHETHVHAEFTEWLEKQSATYLMLGWSNHGQPDEIIDQVRVRYPYLVSYNWMLNSEWYVFSRDASADTVSFLRKTTEVNLSEFASFFSAHPDSQGWVRPEQEWGPTLEFDLVDLQAGKTDIFRWKANLLLPDSVYPVLVVTIQENGQDILWKGLNVTDFPRNTKGETEVSVAIRLLDPKIQLDRQRVKIFIWNKNLRSFRINRLWWELEQGNPHLYGYHNGMQ